MTAIYDTIGLDYANLHKPDRRIERLIGQALGAARTVLNVGAATGSFEPAEKEVTAVEPSVEMIRQRPDGAAPVIQAHAENLPFDDDSFDAVVAVLTVHHWTDQARGMHEMRRVSRGAVVIVTYDPAFPGFWLTDYLPELVALDEHQMPELADCARWLGPAEVAVVPIPHDCTEGFLSAYWHRPAAYLDLRVRSAMSSFRLLGNVSAALSRLQDDVGSGPWAERNAGLIDRTACDCGYRLLTTK